MYTLLIVDDEDLARYALRKMISRVAPNIEVVGEAENATKALTQVEELQPDIVVMDINLPGTNGLDTARQIKERKTGVHILVVTAHDSFAFAQRAVQLHLDGYLLKPVRESDFAEEIRRISEDLDVKNGMEDVPARRSQSAGSELPYPRDAEKRFLAMLGSADDRRVGDNDIQETIEAFVAPAVDVHTAKAHAIEFLVFLRRELGRLPGEETVITGAHIESLGACANKPTLAQLLGATLRSVVQAAAPIGDDSLLKRIDKYIASHDLQQLSLELVSDHLGMTPQYLSRVFKHRYGKKFLEYVTEKRIERAKEILATGEHTVAEAGRLVGYADAYYFSRLFRKLTGLSPKAYVGRRESE